ncbi:hypothetical protein GUJ93_ZPchr0011g27417 [Zizania palustris]|uniref:Uncharacterized protein n=1 Tax=Zizania palustris TaxID=103762 RepID=A0A8J5WG22_ZIZPA|nr:hypothetical protein GUJ93_ZPchr0011g27417 [Zizania palustris]
MSICTPSLIPSVYLSDPSLSNLWHSGGRRVDGARSGGRGAGDARSRGDDGGMAGRRTAGRRALLGVQIWPVALAREGSRATTVLAAGMTAGWLGGGRRGGGHCSVSRSDLWRSRGRGAG